ncbi:hypothetical protein [Inconstantimicrobium mannanitabidum]|uniref:Uncharacterized protein n=1 Tax=Inconstantimicrobium mannanitabidum TaxID=1604901 RepID=A0ACB5RC50_9CLOT|nr:hypothetical protein [Clostridium sp. TW13]GKX66747.1 hypothetical protein rsdtw13_20050 [Clostridium sp. TW13]
MKINKLDFMLYVKTGKLSLILYLIASLIILIPISIALIADIHFSSNFSRASIGVAFVFVLVGKLLSLIKKKKGDKSIPADVGLIIGITIAFIAYILK